MVMSLLLSQLTIWPINFHLSIMVKHFDWNDAFDLDLELRLKVKVLFESHKKMFSSVSVKKTIFESQFCDSMFSSISKKFYVFYAFWTQAIILRKAIRRPASCGQNFKVEKFQFQIISKPFDQSTLYLLWW